MVQILKADRQARAAQPGARFPSGLCHHQESRPGDARHGVEPVITLTLENTPFAAFAESRMAPDVDHLERLEYLDRLLSWEQRLERDPGFPAQRSASPSPVPLWSRSSSTIVYDQ